MILSAFWPFIAWMESTTFLGSRVLYTLWSLTPLYPDVYQYFTLLQISQQLKDLSYQKLRIMRYRLDKNEVLTNGYETLNILFSSSL